MMVMMIQGLFETHIHVKNLERSAEFYENVLGMELAHIEERRRVRFYWIGKKGEAVLGVWEIPETEWKREHFAFRTSLENMKRVEQFLRERGIEPRNFTNDNKEALLQVHAWVPAVSVYFRDPDGHSLEFISLLPDEPKPELGVVSWEEWEALNGRGK
jgi:lactoylglutathione lyase